MNKREKFLKEISEVINRNSMEAYFNDTPDYILAKVAVVAMENFAEASALRELARVQEADKPGEVVRNEDCDNCRFGGFARSIRSRRRSTSQRRCEQWRNFSARCSTVPK